jgi:predicted Fe-Mo cluster-binding NifX family protein
MNIAIPVFGSRVSPRFDGAASFLLIRVEDGIVRERAERPMYDTQGWRRIEILAGNKVDVLLCCGIRQCDYYSIANAGIDVYPGLMGETEEVLEAFLKGEISRNGAHGDLPPVTTRWRKRGGRRGNRTAPGRRRQGHGGTRRLEGEDRRNRSS